nr:helix-turn-helix domain-containing protein [Halorussus sp. JP-T4]
MRLTAVGHGDDLRDLLDALPDAVDVTVLSVGPFTRGLGATLTGRQREALAAAWGVGYYEVPRDGDVEAVAAELDCAVSTASTLLRRAESRLVADALGERSR